MTKLEAFDQISIYFRKNNAVFLKVITDNLFSGDGFINTTKNKKEFETKLFATDVRRVTFVDGEEIAIYKNGARMEYKDPKWNGEIGLLYADVHTGGSTYFKFLDNGFNSRSRSAEYSENIAGHEMHSEFNSDKDIMQIDEYFGNDYKEFVDMIKRNISLYQNWLFEEWEGKVKPEVLEKIKMDLNKASVRRELGQPEFTEVIKLSIKQKFKKLFKKYNDFDKVQADEKFINEEGRKVYRYEKGDDLIEIHAGNEDGKDFVMIITKDIADKDTYDNKKCTFMQPIEKYVFTEKGLYKREYTQKAYDEEIHFDIKYDGYTFMLNELDLDGGWYNQVEGSPYENPFTFDKAEEYKNYFGYFNGEGSNLRGEWRIYYQYQRNMGEPDLFYSRILHGWSNRPKRMIEQIKEDYKNVSDEIEKALAKTNVYKKKLEVKNDEKIRTN